MSPKSFFTDSKGIFKAGDVTLNEVLLEKTVMNFVDIHVGMLLNLTFVYF